MGRLAYEFLKGSISQPAAVLLYMREKHRLYMRSTVGGGGAAFLYELNYVFGGGAGGCGLDHRVSFLRSKREKEESFQAEMLPVNQLYREGRPGVTLMLRAHRVGDIFPGYF